jgi:hypothetical protein
MLWSSQDIWHGQQERKTGDDLHTYQTVGQTDPGCCDPHAQVRVSVFHKPEGLKPQLFCYADLDTTYLHTFSVYSHQDIHPLAIFCLSNPACHVRYARRLCPKISSCSFNRDITPHRIAIFVSSILRVGPRSCHALDHRVFRVFRKAFFHYADRSITRITW